MKTVSMLNKQKVRFGDLNSLYCSMVQMQLMIPDPKFVVQRWDGRKWLDVNDFEAFKKAHGKTKGVDLICRIVRTKDATKDYPTEEYKRGWRDAIVVMEKRRAIKGRRLPKELRLPGWLRTTSTRYTSKCK